MVEKGQTGRQTRQAWIQHPSTTGYYCHVKHLRRLVSHTLSVSAVGIEPENTTPENRLFEQIGVCFVINGTATCHEDERSWHIEGPCVIFQWPGHQYRHTPDSTWEAFYFTFDKVYMPYFRSQGWADFSGCHVVLPDADKLRNYGLKLQGLCRQLGYLGAVDRIDHFCEQILLDVLLSKRQSAGLSVAERLDHIRDFLEANYADRVDVDTLARQSGFAPRTFWRHWRQRFGVTPVTYLTDLKMRRACELLAGGNLSIGQVAGQVGFDDPYYFSRRFHQVFGQSPNDFRKQHQRPGVSDQT